MLNTNFSSMNSHWSNLFRDRKSASTLSFVYSQWGARRVTPFSADLYLVFLIIPSLSMPSENILLSNFLVLPWKDSRRPRFLKKAVPRVLGLSNFQGIPSPTSTTANKIVISCTKEHVCLVSFPISLQKLTVSEEICNEGLPRGCMGEQIP